MGVVAIHLKKFGKKKFLTIQSVIVLEISSTWKVQNISILVYVPKIDSLNLKKYRFDPIFWDIRKECHLKVFVKMFMLSFVKKLLC